MSLVSFQRKLVISVYIIHISHGHGFEGDIPEYLHRGVTKALARHVTRCQSRE